MYSDRFEQKYSRNARDSCVADALIVSGNTSDSYTPNTVLPDSNHWAASGELPAYHLERELSRYTRYTRVAHRVQPAHLVLPISHLSNH
jgi:hypothetical protein